MKTTFATLALSLAGVMAAPATDSIKRQQAPDFPYSISSISLKHITESNAYNYIFSVTQYTSTGEPSIGTTCQTSWNPSVPAGPENPQGCAHKDFSFYFPSGVPSLENYELTVTGPAGQVSGQIAAGPKYQCGPYEGHLNDVDYECKSTNGGRFVFPLI
ncbi:uncharacterized protein BDV17DRAFT_291414 [Aspergillus undulatus]|uniref:uncharacterized protein n=1 Tax=Aspergillus undulatus TaxID=1810928 RepID=UPI003CCDE6FA